MNNKILQVDNYIITESLINIINKLKTDFPGHKLRDLQECSSEIVLTCVNSNHAGANEAHPDAHINLDSSRAFYGAYHCFACGASTDFIGFIALYLDRNRDYAKQWLIKNYGTKAVDTIMLDEPINLNNQVKKYLDESILNNYQSWTPYLAQRKLSRETCTNFKVRYDPYLRNVIFPVYNIYGKLVMLARRNVDTKFFHMDKNVEKEVYALNIIQKNNINKAIITEGPFDTLSGWENDIPTIGTLGTISDYQIAQINKSSITVLYLGFDNDAAGRRFAEIVKDKLDKRIIIVDLDLPADKKDLNDLSKEDWQKIKEKFFQNN